MCAELLSRMKKDGIIDYNRNRFEIVRRGAPYDRPAQGGLIIIDM